MTSASGHWNKTGITLGIDEYSSNGWKYGQGGYARIPLDYVPTVPFEINFKVMSIGSYDITFFVDSGSYYLNLRKTQNKIELKGNSSQSTAMNDLTGEYTLKVYSDKMELYKGDTYLLQSAISSITPAINLEVGSQTGRWIQIKDYKIRKL